MITFNSNFYLQREWIYSKWNATQTVEFLMNTQNSGINITIPKWNIERVVWNEAPWSNWTVTRYSTSQKLTIHGVNSGTWTVECNSTNLIKSLLVRKGAILTYLVNVTDTVNIYTNFKQKLTTGAANLTVFPLAAANHNDSVQVRGNTSIRFAPWTINNTALENLGAFTLQVMWCNGTEVGLNSTSLTVLSIPTKLIHLRHNAFASTGDSVNAFVNFFNNYTNKPITGASVLVKNSTNNAVWPAPFQIKMDYLNGTYDIEILTLGLNNGEYYFAINLSKPLYRSSEVSGLSMTIGGGPSNVSVTAPGCRGLLAINSSHVVANPAPYHNTTIKVRVFYFNALTLQPLVGGIITGSWLGGGPGIIWVPAFFGYYNITIDVTGFHAGSNHTLKLSIQQVGYTAAILYIIVPIRKLPTMIEPLETHYEAYLADSLSVFAVFEDTFNSESIPSVYELYGNFTIQINGFSQNMTRLLPSIGIYQSTLILSQLHLTERVTYNITLFAFSSEHQFASVNLSLFIIPKKQVNLTLLGLPEFLLAGMPFKVYASLTDINRTALSNVLVTFTQRFYPGNLLVQTQETTNSSGVVVLNGEALAMMQSIIIEAEYSGNTTVQDRIINSSFIPIIILNSSLSFYNLPTKALAGDNLEITAKLLINDTPANNELITFTFTYEGSSEKTIKSAGTDIEGKASVNLLVLTGIKKIYVTVSYNGLSYINASISRSEIPIITLGSCLTLCPLPVTIVGNEPLMVNATLLINGTQLAGEIISFRVTYLGLEAVDTLSAGTDTNGMVSVNLIIPAGITKLYITASYGGKSYVNASSTQASVLVTKLGSSLTISPLPYEIREGDLLTIKAKLLINGTGSAGRIITFTCTYDGSSAIDVFSAGTDINGVASIQLSVPSGVSKLHISASFEGLSYINASSSTSSVNVISVSTLVWRYAPIWLSITLAVIGIILTYKYGYKRTTVNRLKAKWRTTSQKFQDALNLNFLMIILRNSGIPVFSYSFKGEKVDYELMSGFLQAISMFKKELIKTDKKSPVKKPEWEMSYQEFRIFGIDREFVQFIAILEEAPSESLKNTIYKFIGAVEDKYLQLFTKFRGNTTEFESINKIIRDHFETTLILPYYAVNVPSGSLKQLSDLERQIYNLGMIFMKQQGYFYINNLLESISGMAKKNKDQILYETYSLIQKNYFTSSKMSMLLG